MKLKYYLLPFLLLAGLFVTACDKDEIVRPPIEWTWEILTPESVQYEGGSVGWSTSVYFKANGKEGDVVITCNNYSSLSFSDIDSDNYDCGWASIRIEGNKVYIHFPYMASDKEEAFEKISITAQDGEKTALGFIGLTRTFESGEQPGTGDVPEEARFKLIRSGFTPFMQLDSPLPAPLDLLTFRITDIHDNYSPVEMPEFTQYYDSIVWCADDFPLTLRVSEKDVTSVTTEHHLTSQWSSHFFRSGTIKTHLKGYSQGEVKYESSLDVNLYERDFLCIEWGPVVLLNPKNLTTYCLLDTTYEYQVNDILAIGEDPYSDIIPVNNKLLPHADYMTDARKAIKTLMETNIGIGQPGKGKEHLFKCLPEKNTEAELYWENNSSRIIMLHQIPGEEDDPMQEKYYLHIEPKRWTKQ